MSGVRATGDLTISTVRWRATDPTCDKRIHVEDVVAAQWAGGRVVRELHRIGALAVLESVVPAVPTRRK